MTSKQNALTGGANGTTVTVSNSAGGGDAFNSVTIQSGTTLTYDTTHGTAAKFTGTASGNGSFVQWTAFSTTRISGQLDLYMTAYSSPSVQIMMLLKILRSSQQISIYTDHLGKLTINENGVGNVGSTVAGAIPLNQWCRIIFDFNTLGSGGTYDLRVYANTTDETPSGTISGTRNWAGGSVASTAVQIGMSDAFETSSYFIASPSISNQVATFPFPHTTRTIAPPPMEMYQATQVPIVTTFIYLDISPPPLEMYLDMSPPDFTFTDIQPPEGVGGDSFVDAYPIQITEDGDTFESLVFSNAGYSTETGEPASGSGPSAWWSYKPLTSGVVSLNNGRGSGDLWVNIWESSGPPHSFASLSRLAFDDDSYGSGRSLISSYTVTGGKTYFISCRMHTSGFANYALDLTGPATLIPVPPVVVDVPANEGVVLTMYPPIVTLSPIAIVTMGEFTPIDSELLVPNLVFPGTAHVNVPMFTSIELIMGVPVVSGFTVISASPVDDAVIPTTSVTFSFLLQSDDPDIFISVVVSDTPTFDVIRGTATVEAEDTEGLDANTVTVSSDLVADVTYYWRYDLTVNGGYIKGTDIRSFTIDPETAATAYTGSWTVVDGTAAPVIWFIHPAGGQVGDLVTIYGQGLAATSTRVMVGAVEAVIASADYLDADPVLPPIIDEISGTVTVSHDEVLFLIPDVAAPGAQVTVVV